MIMINHPMLAQIINNQINPEFELTYNPRPYSFEQVRWKPLEESSDSSFQQNFRRWALRE